MNVTRPKSYSTFLQHHFLLLLPEITLCTHYSFPGWYMLKQLSYSPTVLTTISNNIYLRFSGGCENHFRISRKLIY